MLKHRGAAASTGGTNKRGSTGVRGRLLDVAEDLFYREGVRAVGVDLIVERSGVAKTSLYRHFATKDDLVAAVLERDDAAYWDHWNDVATHHLSDARAELEAHLTWIADDIAGPKYRGCPFLNVVTEFPAAEHPARLVAARHKRELRRRLADLAMRIGVQDPGGLADRLVLLVDGTYVNGQLFGPSGPTRSFVPAALALVSLEDLGSSRASRSESPSQPAKRSTPGVRH